MTLPLIVTPPADLGLDPRPLERLCGVIERQIADGGYPGAQVAVARHGSLALARSFGVSDPATDAPTSDDTLFLLYSNTKVVLACALWALVEDGHLTFADHVADHLPGFTAHDKGEVTLIHLLTHQAGFPSADMPEVGWEDRDAMRAAIRDWPLEWPTGSRVRYHPSSAHWTLAAVMEAVTGQDFRAVVRERVIAPLGLTRSLFVGLPDPEHPRAARIQDPRDGGGFTPRGPENTSEGRRAGIPGGGGYGTARAMAIFYQMLAGGGALGGTRIVSPRLISQVTRNHTGDLIDDYMGLPMHRGLGVQTRGHTTVTRGLGSLAHPGTFGHGGVGSSYCWADPDSGVSFAFLSNCRQTNEYHDRRMEVLSNLVHAAILDR